MGQDAPRQVAVIARRQEATTEILLLSGPDGLSLPIQRQSDIAGLHADIADRFGLVVSTLDCIGREPRFFVFESVDGRTAKNGHWFRTKELPAISGISAAQRAMLDQWFTESELGGTGRPPWTCFGWYAPAADWATDRLRAAGFRSNGNPVQAGMRSWSYQLRLPAIPRDLYFKASPPVYGHEAAVSLLLSERFPKAVPNVLAVDERRGWMLTEDFGGIRHSANPAETVDAYVRMVPELARLQRGMAEQADALLATGCPDHRLEILPGLYDALVAEVDGLTVDERRQLVSLSARFRDHCARLAGSGVPHTIIHLDIWRGNYTFTDTGPLIFDWAESVLGHPFVSLDVVLRDVRSVAPSDLAAERQVADAYLREWADISGPVPLDEALQPASAPGIVSRALLWRDALATLRADRALPFAGTVAAQLRELLILQPHVWVVASALVVAAAGSGLATASEV
ncbi:phosphotransferase [Streptomyces marianii]|nr:phosphotransferase [Streptomyces marianii]